MQVTDQPPVWLIEILRELRQDGYRLTYISGQHEELSEAKLHKSMGLITCDEADSVWLQQILTKVKKRPLHILVTDEVKQTDCADFIFPAHPALLREQLRNLLMLYSDNHSLSSALRREQMLNQEIEILKNAIVRNVSHELKTPLLQVKSAVSMMSEDSQNDDLVNYATNAMARLEGLVKNITLLGSSLDINPGPVIVRDAVEYAKRNLKRAWERRDATDRIQTHLTKQLPPVYADKQGLSTVLQLLIDNALKFSQEAVDVIAQKQGNKVYIAVRDYGIGIDPSELESIFESFYQIDHSSTRRYGGAGVGLAIVRLILDHHNTQIQVESKLNQGTTFSFVLPQVTL
jgi:signal transduction histidine kinase